MTDFDFEAGPVAGPLLGSGDLLLAGVVVLVAGVGFLTSQAR